MEVFPEELAIIVFDGFTQTISGVNTLCLSGSTNTSRQPSVDASLVFLTPSDMNDFFYWWSNDIDYGAKVFTITLPFMGVTRAWEVIIDGGFTTSLKSSTLRTVQIKLELQEDITEFLPVTTYGNTFPEEVGCVVVSGYAESSGSTIKCLSGYDKRTTKELLTATIFIESREMLANYAGWFVNELTYGNDDFYITLPFMGTTNTWKVTLTNDLLNSLLHTKISEITMELEMLDYEPTTPV